MTKYFKFINGDLHEKCLFKCIRILSKNGENNNYIKKFHSKNRDHSNQLKPIPYSLIAKENSCIKVTESPQSYLH